ncbi:MAG: autotransporter-associated beta strand repeat-containing protein [Paludibacter sp.]|nr:autotransporter-associated beta strand repeat-containing protein [Paludibacter sp.]
MKKNTTQFYLRLFPIIILFFLSGGVKAQRPMEKLDRSVIAQKVSNGIFVNWRITSDEWYNTYYKVYRNGTLIYTTTTAEASNYLDTSGNTSSVYTVTSVKDGIESAPSKAAKMVTTGYIEIPMHEYKKGYILNDATAADLDGDGEYEIIIKRLNLDYTVENDSAYSYFEAYKMDGTFLWEINVGPNILSSSGVEINIAAFDFDGDGKAEVFMRTSEGTIFGDGTKIGDTDGDGKTNYRYSVVQSANMQYMNAGPEFLSLIDGMTGAELDRVNFIPRGNSSDWGDSYGHRANKFFFGAPYLDGIHPSLFIGRGIYTMTKMQTYDVVNKKLVKRWYWECTSADDKQQGKWDDEPKRYFGQGYHNYTVADGDGDGKDEICWGSMAIDNDGKPLYSTELGHGDAQHYGDLDPYRKGQEAFACNEDNPGTNLRDAKTGKILYRSIASSDVGRAGAGNITDAYRGAEVWGNGKGLSATDRVELNHFGVAENYCIYWDGDLCQEILDHSGFSTSTGVGYGSITKFNGYGNITTLLTANAYSCNYTKGTPCLQADILGDWREEAIWWRTDGMALRIYTTPYTTTNRIYTLMHDHQYRQAICWQMCGYNQPPHTSFYLGSDFPTPIPAKSTNGKLVWTGTSSDWNTTTANFMNGDDAEGILAGTSPATQYSNGKSVLFDAHGTSKTVNIDSNLSPELLMVSSDDDYTIGGNGSLTGKMILDKMGEGTLNLNGNHSYSGATTIWEGNLWLSGSLNNSKIIVRRHANFNSNGTCNKGIVTEYNASVYVGGSETIDTMIVSDTLKLVKGAKLIFDLTDSNEANNDLLILNGVLTIESGSIININQRTGNLSPGNYLLAKGLDINGDIKNIKVTGAVGVATDLSYDETSKELYLIVKGVRSASSVVWTGTNGSAWDLATTTNWTKDGSPDIFVTGDSVYFETDAVNHSVTLAEDLTASYLNITSDNDYIFSGTGQLTGNMDLFKSGSGTLTINNRNSFTGKTTIEGGSLIMQYAPSSTNNGGIGTDDTNAANFILKDSAIVQILTNNEITDRGVTMSGTGGGVLNVANALYWNGVMTGTKMTKIGSGTLYIGSNNTGLTESVLKSGKIKLNTDASVQYGVGKKITLMGGTLETLNSTGAYLTSNNAFYVPEGCTSSIIAGARCEYNGTLTGSGTLNWSCDFIRAYMNGNWSAFEGKLNITANGANSNYENHFIVNNSNGFPNAIITLNSGVLMCYKNGTSDNGTTTIKVGMLTGSGDVYNAGLEVGTNNTNGIFYGVISGSSNVKKTGTGIWMVNGDQTYTGTTTISAGTMNVSGSLSTGTITVQADGLLNLSGTSAGSVIISNGGTLNLTGTVSGNISNTGLLKGTGTVKKAVVMGNNSNTMPGSSIIGTLHFGSNLSMNASATLNMQVNGTSGSCDLLDIAGILTCNGTLDVTINSGTPTIGNEYQLFNAGSIAGTFATITLPELPQGMEWNTNGLYTEGKIAVVESTGINNPEIRTGVLQNPTNGLFTITTNELVENAHIMVYNLQGKIIFRSTVNSFVSNFEIDLRDQPDGIYLMKLITNKGNSNILKLIKQ